jgi:hypothetical protein
LNYTFAASGHTGTITNAGVVVNLAGTRVYDGTVNFTAGQFTATITGTLNGETLTIASGTGTVPSPNVGTQTLSIGNLKLGDGTGSASNYTLVGGTHTGTITARGITLTANNQSKIYGNADPALTFSVGGLGLAVGDTNATVFSGGLARATGAVSTSGKDVVGSYAINQGTLAANSNYSVTTFTAGTLTVTQRSLTVTYTGVDKVYDGGTTATVNTTDNRVVGDLFTINRTAAFLDKNAGTGKTVNVTGASLSTADAGNYQLTSTSATQRRSR